VSGQLDDSKVATTDRSLDLVEADTDRRRRRRGRRSLAGRHRRRGRRLDAATPAARRSCTMLTTAAGQRSIHNKTGTVHCRPVDCLHRSLRTGQRDCSSFAPASLHFHIPPFSVAALPWRNGQRYRQREAPGGP